MGATGCTYALCNCGCGAVVYVACDSVSPMVRRATDKDVKRLLKDGCMVARAADIESIRANIDRCRTKHPARPAPATKESNADGK